MSKSKDESGTVQGNLIIGERKREDGRTYYWTECTLCGTQKWMRADRIHQGATSCGCKGRIKPKDLTEMKFGRLTAICPTEQRASNGTIIWKCKCECENKDFVFVNAGDLFQERVRSCGCLGSEVYKANGVKMGQLNIKRNIVEGTNLAVIKNKKPLKNNKSGVRGVTYDKTRGKWRPQIIFQGHSYYLGRYDTKEEAIDARKEAEKNLHDKFLEWYKERYKNNKDKTTSK